MPGTAVVTVTPSAAILLVQNGSNWNGSNVILKNSTGTATIRVGGSNVTDTIGWPWAVADGPLSVPLDPGEALYGCVITAGANQTVDVLGVA